VPADADPPLSEPSPSSLAARIVLAIPPSSALDVPRLLADADDRSTVPETRTGARTESSRNGPPSGETRPTVRSAPLGALMPRRFQASARLPFPRLA